MLWLFTSLFGSVLGVDEGVVVLPVVPCGVVEVWSGVGVAVVEPLVVELGEVVVELGEVVVCGLVLVCGVLLWGALIVPLLWS